MKKKQRKLLSFLIIPVLISFLFAACTVPLSDDLDNKSQYSDMEQFLSDFEENFTEEHGTPFDKSFCGTTVLPDDLSQSRNTAGSKFTWSIIKNWTSSGSYRPGNGTRIFPPQGTNLRHLLPAPRLSPIFPYNVDENFFVELVKMALASWQANLDIEMTQVTSGGNLEIDVVANIGIDEGWTQYGAAGYAPGGMNGRIVLGLYRRTGNYGEEEYLPFDDVNHTYATTLHEFGHNLGISHAWTYSDYKPSPAYNYAAMDYHYLVPGVGIRQYLSDWDIKKGQARWGVSKYKPFIQLWIPSWNKSFYTTSWNEANILARSSAASDVEIFYGAMYKNLESYTKPLYRAYHPQVPKHYFTLYPLSGNGIKYEGIMGYLIKYNYRNLTGIYRHYSSYINNHIFSSSSTPPGGYVYDSYYGAVIGYSSMVGYQSEHSYF